MPLNGNIVPQTYYDDTVDSPYPTTSSPISTATGQILTCSRTGRMWLETSVSPFYVPISLQYQTTSAGAGATTANIRRVNSGAAGNEVAGFEHTGAMQLTDLLSAPMLGTDATGRVHAVASAPAVTIRARNNTGFQINKGQAVRISGAFGQNPTISLAQANAYATTDAVGLAAANIANGSTGSVIIAGTLTNLDTSAFSDGATLYLSAATAGALTATEPSRPNWQMQMGYVERSDSTQGKILVHPNLESTKTEYISDMTSAGVALATLAPMSDSTLIGRGSGLGSGDPGVITLGYGTQMGGLGNQLVTSLSSSQSFITADVTMTNASQFYNITSISLAAGTWFVTGSAVFTAPTNAAITSYTLEIQNSNTSATLASSSSSHGAIATLPVNASASAIVTLSSTTTIAMRGQANVAGRVVKYQSNPANLDKATGIVAVRIA